MPFSCRYPDELSTDQRQELEALLETTKNVKVYRRVKVILYLYQGRSIDFVAEHTGYTRRCQYYWLSHYVHQGVSGLADRPREGNVINLSALHVFQG